MCYREVDDKHLQNFQEELEAEGNMTEEVKEVIQQIQEAPRQQTNQPTQVGFHVGDFFMDFPVIFASSRMLIFHEDLISPLRMYYSFTCVKGFSYVLLQRYVAEAWWDPELDNGNCQYSYNERKDSWGPYVGPAKKILKGIASALKTSDSGERQFLFLDD